MTTISTEVLVIGGGATGAGVAWDAALRGFDVVLVDRADLAEGTSGRFHGLLLSGEELDIEAGFTLNASGAWAAQIVKMAGIEGIGVIPGKGIMIAMNHRLVNTVVNRCTMPADGDILVPIRTVSVIGTTDVRESDPDELPVTQAEVDQMLADGDRLVPGFREARALRVWAGVRPLFQDQKAGEVG